MPEIYQHQLSNGLKLLAEPVGGSRSLAMTLLMPGGVAHEPAGRQGVATMLAELLIRGAGDLDARRHTEALDQLGIRRSTSADGVHLRISATMIGEKFSQALPLIADMAMRPQLPESGLEPTRALCLQTLDSIEDEPQQKVMQRLRMRHLPQPFGRPMDGEREAIEKMTRDEIRSHWQSTCVPGGAVLGIAGCFNWDELKATIEKTFGDWQGQRDDVQDQDPSPRGYEHVTQDTAQVHIGIAYDAVPQTDDAAMLQKAAIAVLSGGMSGRLFTEVREKRGLCYSVGARYSADHRRGAVYCYTGTGHERAQESLDVVRQELKRIGEGVDQSEFERAIVGMKSRLVMQGESTGSRAGAIAIDQYIHGRPRTLDELAEKVDAVTLDALNAFVAEHVPQQFTVVTVGPEELKI